MPKAGSFGISRYPSTARSFVDVTGQAGTPSTELHSSCGTAAADIMNDGRMWIAVNEMHEAPSLLMPQGPAKNHWIGIRLIGTKSNRDGIGAVVELKAGALRRIDEVRSGGSYLSQSDLRLHFGTGSSTRVDTLTVKWPSGQVDTWRDLPVDRHITLKEGHQKLSFSPN